MLLRWGSDDIDDEGDLLTASALARGRHDTLSYFAFTAILELRLDLANMLLLAGAYRRALPEFDRLVVDLTERLGEDDELVWHCRQHVDRSSPRSADRHAARSTNHRLPGEPAVRPEHREFHSDWFDTNIPPYDGPVRVLLIDDAWTTGAGAQSLAYALKTSGVATVATIVLGRHVNPDHGFSAPLLAAIADTTFDVSQCYAEVDSVVNE